MLIFRKILVVFLQLVNTSNQPKSSAHSSSTSSELGRSFAHRYDVTALRMHTLKDEP